MINRKYHAASVKLLALFVVLAGIPSAALGWLGWRLLEQDRALENQRLRERLENAADLLARELDRGLARWEDLLPAAAPATSAALPPSAVFLVFDSRGILGLGFAAQSVVCRLRADGAGDCGRELLRDAGGEPGTERRPPAIRLRGGGFPRVPDAADGDAPSHRDARGGRRSSRSFAALLPRPGTRCELRRAGKVVELSALEFKLLAAFVKHSGRLLTRAQLLDEVWGPGTNVTDRVVDNQVTNLRKKIEPEPERPRYLVALRGLGYRFDGEGVTER